MKLESDIKVFDTVSTIQAHDSHIPNAGVTQVCSLLSYFSDISYIFYYIME